MSAQSLKIVLLLIAIGLTVLLFTWPSGEERLTLSTKMDVGDVDVEISAKVKASDLATTAATVMLKPKFFGEDDEQRKWSLSADRAIQGGVDTSETVQLEEIDASSTLKDGSNVSLKAKKGAFVAATQELALSEGVELKGLGYTLKTDGLSGNIKTQNLRSDTKVSVEGASGEFSAGAFEMKGLDGHLHLSEGVKMRFYPNRTEKEYLESKN